jgi:prolyl oligopeptidase
MVTEQVFFPSKDGTKISMFVIHDKDAKKDGKNPVILYGYGGFNVSMTPSFAGSRAVWLEHGGVYAIPNLRGGGEYGEDWHKAGMLLKKQNVFDDYIAAAEFLIKEGWTSREHLAISGGSNGGLLVGAAMTQRPDLYRAVICAVPLLDMLRYHLFGSGKTWVPEYGSAEDAEQFKVLWAYSPYRLAIDDGPRAYPAVLFDSADHDDRVDPLHARKLAAAVQALQTSDRPVLLRIERNSGHGGADMVKQQVDRIADQYAFLLQQLK